MAPAAWSPRRAQTAPRSSRASRWVGLRGWGCVQATAHTVLLRVQPPLRSPPASICRWPVSATARRRRWARRRCGVNCGQLAADRGTQQLRHNCAAARGRLHIRDPHRAPTPHNPPTHPPPHRPCPSCWRTSSRSAGATTPRAPTGRRTRVRGRGERVAGTAGGRVLSPRAAAPPAADRPPPALHPRPGRPSRPPQWRTASW